MAYSKVYTRINWKNYPAEDTPLNESNLNKLDYAVNELDNRVIAQEVSKADKTEVNSCLSGATYNEKTGIITLTKKSGEQIIFDLNIEKVPVSFTLSSAGVLTMTTADGTKFTADIGSMIPILTFNSSSTITVNTTGTGVNKTYSFSVKPGSITGAMLETNYLADIRVAAGQAQAAAETAEAKADIAVQKAEISTQNAAAALASKNAAAASAQTATAKALAADGSEKNALAYKNAAESAKDTATTKANAASASASTAATKANEAASSKISAQTAAQTAESNAGTATSKAIEAQSYSRGGTGTRAGEDVDNAKYYMEQAKAQTGGIPIKVSQLQNDTGYITKAVTDLVNYYSASQTYSKTEVNNLITAIPKFAIKVVAQKPTSGISSTTIYLIPSAENAATNQYEEWIYVNNNWEMLGNLAVDLSGYLQISSLAAAVGTSTITSMTQKAITDAINKKEAAFTKNTAFNKSFETLASNIKMNGTAAVGGSANTVRADHIHPSDTSKLSTGGDGSNVTVAFTQATSRTNLVAGETIKIAFGKIAKWFADLKTVAFSGSYNDLSNRPTLGTAASAATVNNCTTTAAGSLLDARQGKVLQDAIDQTNSNLGKIQYLNMRSPNGDVTGNRADKNGSCIFIVAQINVTSDILPNAALLVGEFHPLIKFLPCGGVFSLSSGLYRSCFVTEGAIHIDNSVALTVGTYCFNGYYTVLN